MPKLRFLLPIAFIMLLLTFSPAALAQELSDHVGTLPPTLELRDTPVLGGSAEPLAWQSGAPLPSFDPQDRPRVDLAGEWRKLRFNADHDLSLSLRNNAAFAALEADGIHAADYDDSAWETINLPRVENRMPTLSGSGAGPENYENGVWYRRTADIPAEWDGRRVTLNFLGVNYVVDVWVNGQWAGYHEGGFTPFALDVAPLLNFGGTNTIALRVDNPVWGSRIDTVPAIKPDWFNYTGVIQDVYFESTRPLSIVRADVLTPDTSGSVEVSVVLYNTSDSTQSAELTLDIAEANPNSPAWLTDTLASAIAGETVVTTDPVAVEVPAGEALIVNAELTIPDVKLWAIRQPNLYVLRAALDNGGYFSTQFGVRTVTTESYHLLLNDEPTFLAGVARHEDSGDRGRSMTLERIVSDFQIIDGLNANFIRTAHYPNHIATYIILDRLGITAAVEIPMWQATEVEYGVQEQRRIADQMWREMIYSNRNRPSILMWSTNNESREVPFRDAYSRQLVDDFHTNYPDGRLVTQSAAADRGGPGDESQIPLDVAGWTMYFGIFHGSTYYQGTADFLAAAHGVFPDKPVLNTEYGIWSAGDSNERRQAEVFTETFRALTEVSAWDAEGNYNDDGFVAGITWWAAFDWYTAHTRLQTMGLFRMDRTYAKDTADLVREAYSVWNPLVGD